MHVITLAVVFSIVQLTTAACTNPKVRREWGELSATEKQSYIAAVKVLNSRKMSNQYTDPTRMSLADFTLTHAQNAWWAHVNAQFLIYHRAMMFLFEQAMISAGWSGGGIVYLDEAGHQTDWQGLDLFSNQYFGGESSSDQCLTTGPFTQANGYLVLGNSGNQDKCLTRCGGGTFTDPYTIVNQISTSTTYEGVRAGDSNNFHANGHMVMGGVAPDGVHCDMFLPDYSPRDPLFFLHHAYVDKYYWKWQMLCPNHYTTDYEGNYATSTDVGDPSNGGGKAVSATNPLDSWQPLTAADVFDSRSDLLCFTYTKSASDVAYSHPNCPDGSAPNFNPFAGSTQPPPSSSQTGDSGSNQSTATSTAAAPSPTPALATDDQWLYTDLVNLVVHGSSHGTFAPAAPPGGKRDMATNTTAAAKPHKKFSQKTNADNSTSVTVVTGTVTHEYLIPAGCALHRVLYDRITIVPQSEGAWSGPPPRDHPCPAVLFAHPCTEIPECERYPGWKPPTATSKCQYPTFLSDEFIETWNMDKCMVRKSDCRILWNVDECNALA